VYVTHRLREHGAEVWQLLQQVLTAAPCHSDTAAHLPGCCAPLVSIFTSTCW
jgi:hypothetical protein